MDILTSRCGAAFILVLFLVGLPACSKRQEPEQQRTEATAPAEPKATPSAEPVNETELATSLFELMKRAEQENATGKFEAAHETWKQIHQEVSRQYGLDGWQTVSAELAMAAALQRTRMSASDRELATELARLTTSASAAIEKRNFNEARIDIEQAAGISARLWGKESYVTANVNFIRARCYLGLGAHQRAIAVLNDILTLRISLTGMNHPDVETTLDLLAKANSLLKNHAATQQTLEKLVQVSGNLWGETSEIYANRCSELAVSYNNSQQPNLALPWFDKALAVRKSVYGEQSLPAGHVHLNRGMSLVQLKEFNRAKSDLRQALANFQQSKLPPHDPAWAVLLDQLGTIALVHKENQQAQKHFSELADYWRQKEGESHLEYGKSLYKLSVSIGNQGRYSDAEPIMKQAIAIFEEQLGYTNKMLQQPLNTYARLLEKMGVPQEAEKIKDRAVRLAGFQELPN